MTILLTHVVTFAVVMTVVPLVWAMLEARLARAN
jgi:hypothetical protein